MPNLDNAYAKTAKPQTRNYLTLGSYEGKNMQWLDIIHTDRRWYLVSQYLLPGPVIRAESPWTPSFTSAIISDTLEHWCQKTFAKKFSADVPVLRIHAISSVEVDHILKPEEKICSPDNGQPHFWYLDSSFSNDRESCVLVTEKGEVVKEPSPRLGQLYVRVGLELLTPNNPYADKEKYLDDPFYLGWPR